MMHCMGRNSATLGEGSMNMDVGKGYIEHHVSKVDTLAGIAIKYGVEVADIKRANGLVTDIQMFAHKVLKIPLPGRHPPSAILHKHGMTVSSTPRLGKHIIHDANTEVGSSSTKLNGKTPEKRPVSRAMNLLRGYYGLSSPAQADNEGTEMVLYSSSSDHHFANNSELFLTSIKSHNSKAVDKHWPECVKSMMNGNHTIAGKSEIDEIPASLDDATFQDEVGSSTATGDIEKVSEQSVRRRPKVEAGTEVRGRQQARIRERTVIRKSPPRPKTSIVTDSSSFISSSGAEGSSGTLLSGTGVEGLISKVKRSASTPSLEEEKVNVTNSGSKYSSKLDLIALGQTSFNPLAPLPLFEGLSMPIGIRRNKAAMD